MVQRRRMVDSYTPSSASLGSLTLIRSLSSRDRHLQQEAIVVAALHSNHINSSSASQRHSHSHSTQPTPSLLPAPQPISSTFPPPPSPSVAIAGKNSNNTISSGSDNLFPLRQSTVLEFRQQGYIVVKNLFRPETLAEYASVVAEAVSRRTSRLPNVADEELSSPVLKPEPNSFKRQESRPMYLKRRKDVPKFEKKLMEMRMKHTRRTAIAAGMPESEINDLLGSDDNLSEEERNTRVCTPKHLERAEKLCNTPVMKEKARRSVRWEETEQFFKQQYGLAKLDLMGCVSSYSILEQHRLEEAGNTGGRDPSGGSSPPRTHGSPPPLAMMEASSSARAVGAVIGKVAGELGACLSTRLFTDQYIPRPQWCNNFALYPKILEVNYSDPRGVTATVVLPPTDGDGTKGSSSVRSSPGFSSNIEDNSAMLVVPRSHHVLSKSSNKGHNIKTLASFPPGWDPGEFIRYSPLHEELRKLPVVALDLEPGDVVFENILLLSGYSDNVCGRGWREDRSSSDAGKAERSLTDHGDANSDQGGADTGGTPPTGGGGCPKFHSWYTMPEGATFNGSRHHWMSYFPSGPLYKAEQGAPLDHPGMFPVLYNSELGSEDDDE